MCFQIWAYIAVGLNLYLIYMVELKKKWYFELGFQTLFLRGVDQTPPTPFLSENNIPNVK